MVDATETKVYDLAGMIFEKKFDLVEQLLNLNPSVKTVRGLETAPKGLETAPKGLANTKGENQMPPIDAVCHLIREEQSKVVDGKATPVIFSTLKQLFSIARLLLEKGAKIKPDECQTLLRMAIQYKEETLRWLLKANLFTRECLEADLKVHTNEANEISNILQVKTKLEKMDRN